MNGMNVVVLDTAIFPDRETLERAVEHLQKTHRVWCFDASRTGNTDRDWDQALLRLLDADRIIVV
ncbi:MAG: hypothetical protein K8F27_10075 [Sulfuricellaceae bacterium]|nr:hypothetical protein [Sulfuricellaceae bacterium]